MPVSVVVFGAHPDDDDIKAGGSAALWAARGDRVLFVSLTNGDAGHQTLAGAELARRRRAEAHAAAAVLGIRYHVCDHHDGELSPTLDLRREVIRLIREAWADLVLLPRPWDYHPDHRAAAQVVQDAAYMVTVPNVAAFAPHLARNPVFAYVQDGFTRPCPFRADVAVDVTAVAERKLRALHCHASQFYEWLPYNAGRLEEVPSGDAERLAWLGRTRDGDVRRLEACREALVRWYGPERAAACRAAEAFEICELGRRPDDAEMRRLFPLE
jgi:LmbE family N-acetylglucosaminyl deacetylase